MNGVHLPPGTEPFNSYKKLHNVLIPISLGPVPVQQLSWFDKFLYGRLRYEAGNSDRCQVVLTGIAKELGVSGDTVQRSVERLKDARLIATKRLQYKVLVVFLWSELLEGSLPKKERADPAQIERGESTSETAAVRVVKSTEAAALPEQNPQPCPPEPAPVRVVYKEYLGFSFRNKKESSSTEISGLPEQQPEPERSDEDSSPESKTKNPTQNPILDFLQSWLVTSRFPQPLGRNPAEEMQVSLTAAGGQAEDILDFLKDLDAKRKGEVPTTWKYVLTAFHRWLAGPEIRKQFQQRAEARIAKERRQKLLDEATTPDNAAALVSQGRYEYVPHTLVSWLNRRQLSVTPNEVEQLRQQWRVECPKCHNDGTTGTALDKTLALCDCWIGQIEAQEGRQAKIDQEIADTHRDFKSILIAALYQNGNAFTADYLSDLGLLDLSEDSERVTFWWTREPGISEKGTQAALEKAFKLLSDTRKIVFEKQPCWNCRGTGRLASPGWQFCGCPAGKAEEEKDRRERAIAAAELQTRSGVAFTSRTKKPMGVESAREYVDLSKPDPEFKPKTWDELLELERRRNSAVA